jgi:hypothetical protein
LAIIMIVLLNTYKGKGRNKINKISSITL